MGVSRFSAWYPGPFEMAAERDDKLWGCRNWHVASAELRIPEIIAPSSG